MYFTFYFIITPIKFVMFCTVLIIRSIFFSNFKEINGYDRNVFQTEQNYKQILALESEHVNYCHKIKSHDYTFCRKGRQRDN